MSKAFQFKIEFNNKIKFIYEILINLLIKISLVIYNYSLSVENIFSFYIY